MRRVLVFPHSFTLFCLLSRRPTDIKTPIAAAEGKTTSYFLVLQNVKLFLRPDKTLEADSP